MNNTESTAQVFAHSKLISLFYFLLRMNVCRTLFLVLGIILDHRLVQCSSCSFPSESEKFSVNYDRHSDVIVKVEKGFVDDRYLKRKFS